MHRPTRRARERHPRPLGRGIARPGLSEATKRPTRRPARDAKRCVDALPTSRAARCADVARITSPAARAHLPVPPSSHGAPPWGAVVRARSVRYVGSPRGPHSSPSPASQRAPGSSGRGGPVGAVSATTLATGSGGEVWASLVVTHAEMEVIRCINDVLRRVRWRRPDAQPNRLTRFGVWDARFPAPPPRERGCRSRDRAKGLLPGLFSCRGRGAVD